MFKKIIVSLIIINFLFQQVGFAQVAGQLDLSGLLVGLRNSRVSDAFRPLHLRYLSVNAKENKFRILLDKGSLDNPSPVEVEEASKALLSYFLVGLTLPNESFWVNLRPDSPDNIIDDKLARTDAGRVMLQTDLQLKKDTANFTSPQTPIGKEYWQRLYSKAEELYGTAQVTIPTLTRPWIVPGEIIIRETTAKMTQGEKQDGKGNMPSAYIYKATLKVMLEEDYLKTQDPVSKDIEKYSFKDERAKKLNEYSTQVVRELVIPQLTKQINSSKRYAALRQVYYSLILAQWYKQRFSKSLAASGLASLTNRIDSRDLAGLTSREPWSKDEYFREYQKSFKEGEYNIREPVLTPSGQMIRSYFSGGEVFGNLASKGIGEQVVRADNSSIISIAGSSSIINNSHLLSVDINAQDTVSGSSSIGSNHAQETTFISKIDSMADKERYLQKVNNTLFECELVDVINGGNGIDDLTRVGLLARGVTDNSIIPVRKVLLEGLLPNGTLIAGGGLQEWPSIFMGITRNRLEDNEGLRFGGIRLPGQNVFSFALLISDSVKDTREYNYVDENPIPEARIKELRLEQKKANPDLKDKIKPEQIRGFFVHKANLSKLVALLDSVKKEKPFLAELPIYVFTSLGRDSFMPSLVIGMLKRSSKVTLDLWKQLENKELYQAIRAASSKKILREALQQHVDSLTDSPEILENIVQELAMRLGLEDSDQQSLAYSPVISSKVSSSLAAVSSSIKKVPVDENTTRWVPGLDVLSPVDENSIPGFKAWVKWNGFKKGEHEGYDFAVYLNQNGEQVFGLPAGTKIRAVADGVVYMAIGPDKSGGAANSFVTVEYGNSISPVSAQYHHLVPLVEFGQKVKKGEAIGVLQANELDAEGKNLIHLNLILADGMVNPQRKVDPADIYPELNDLSVAKEIEDNPAYKAALEKKSIFTSVPMTEAVNSDTTEVIAGSTENRAQDDNSSDSPEMQEKKAKEEFMPMLSWLDVPFVEKAVLKGYLPFKKMYDKLNPDKTQRLAFTQRRFKNFLEEIGKTFTVNELVEAGYWQKLVELVTRNDAFEANEFNLMIGLRNVKHLIHSADDLYAVGSELLELQGRFDEFYRSTFVEYALPVLNKGKLITTIEDLRNKGNDIIELSNANALSGGALEIAIQMWGEDDLKYYWPGTVRLCVASRDHSYKFFSEFISGLKKLLKDDFKDNWPLIVESVTPMARNIAQGDYLKEVWKNLYEIFERAADIFGQEDFRGYFPYFLRLLSGTKENPITFMYTMLSWKDKINQQSLADMLEWISSGEPFDLDLLEDFISLLGEERKDYFKNKETEILKITQGGFEPSKPAHVLLGYGLLLRLTEEHPALKKDVTYRMWKRLLEGKDITGNLSLSDKEQAEIKYLVYESIKLKSLLSGLKVKADALGRPLVLVENLTYGWMAAKPIEKDLESMGIRLIRTKAGSTYAHDYPEAMHGLTGNGPDDSDLFSAEDLRYLIEKEPIVVVVDGSYSLDPKKDGLRRRQTPRIPDGHQQYRNNFHALSGNANDAHFGLTSLIKKDGIAVSESLRKNPAYQQLRDKARNIKPDSERNNYKFYFWYPGALKLNVSSERVDRDIPQNMMLYDPNNPGTIISDKITGPSVVFVVANMEDSMVPREIRDWASGDAFFWVYHNSAYLDDTDIYQRMFVNITSYGPNISDLFEKQIAQSYQELNALLNKTDPSVSASQSGDLSIKGESSSSSIEGDLGGIDFKRLPIVAEAVKNLSENISQRQIEDLRNVDIEDEWKQIERMVNSGMSPSSERIKEYVQAACVKGADTGNVLTLISEMLRGQEESNESVEPELRDILVLLESEDPKALMKEVLVEGKI